MTTVGSSDDADRLILATLVVQAEEYVFGSEWVEWDEFIEETSEQIDALRAERTRRIFERAARMPEPWRRHLVHRVMVKTFGPVAS